jgi:hypothetical protein
MPVLCMDILKEILLIFGMRILFLVINILSKSKSLPDKCMRYRPPALDLILYLS